eukprot:s693_g6.t1
MLHCKGSLELLKAGGSLKRGVRSGQDLGSIGDSERDAEDDGDEAGDDDDGGGDDDDGDDKSLRDDDDDDDGDDDGGGGGDADADAYADHDDDVVVDGADEDPSTRKLNAKGYVRFASHEEAAGLLAAFPADESDDEEGPGVQGSWSLSERFLQNHLSFLDALQRHLDQLATTCRYSRILLVGGGRLPPAGRGLELSAHGPLCIIAYSKATRTEVSLSFDMGFMGIYKDPPQELEKKTTETTMASMRRRIASGGKEMWTKDRVLEYVKDNWQTIMTQAGMETSNPFASLTVQKDTDEQSEEEPNADEGKDYDKGADKVFTIYYGQFNKTVEVCVNDALANPSNFCEAVGEAGAAAPPTEPCILVRGFPASWREQQVRLVFALFGGIGSVRFASSTGERVAYVELKNKENMPKAVEQLHNTKVGDGELIEDGELARLSLGEKYLKGFLAGECVVSCELFGDSEFSDGRAARRTIFLDELRKPKRPELKADPEALLGSS